MTPVNFEDERRIPVRLPLGNDAGVDAAFETMNDAGQVFSDARAFSGHSKAQIFVPIRASKLNGRYSFISKAQFDKHCF
jgi:hypothetical protein